VRIGFFVQGDGVHWDVARHLISSARKVMPGVEIFQLTDDKTPQHDCNIVRLGGAMPMAVRRMTLHSMLAGDWLFVDTDIVFREDVRDVFKASFHIAVTDRVGSAWENSPDVKDMPYNMGVTFSRSASFWDRVAGVMKSLPPHLQEWCGDQLVVCEMQKQVKTLVLPGLKYNFTPLRREDDISHAAIVHYKGPRKDWIAEHH
jgi:hypothetical protein